ncbi:DUF4349 domain-containing protein [Pedobacter sp. HMF7056]|uniref:DUF4349 domain-containing protein n=1 Tax=Hufsiella ginkgonis TaxID=2695274 RepID=A0A7K1Y4B6_9SPHI|nr:DUF4349 domain-containing protein [Hufsiella ginkgonis]MXV17909.1 DUF4349 domain-containing protein [Hufsiella ginkgonis]
MKAILLFVCCCVIASCKREAGNSESGAEAKAEIMLSKAPDNQVNATRLPPPVPAPDEEIASDFAAVEATRQPGLVADTARKIIKTGEISFETADVKATRARLIETTKKLKGYLAEESESGYENGRKNYTMNLKVPAGDFETLLEAISSAARQIDSKNIHITDVTAEFIDTRTRLANKKQLERRYLELLDKAAKIPDMITIENKLSEIRGEIESVEGQLLYMKSRLPTVRYRSRSTPGLLPWKPVKDSGTR